MNQPKLSTEDLYLISTALRSAIDMWRIDIQQMGESVVSQVTDQFERQIKQANTLLDKLSDYGF